MNRALTDRDLDRVQGGVVVTRMCMNEPHCGPDRPDKPESPEVYEGPDPKIP